MVTTTLQECLAGLMFWQIAELKLFGKKKFGEWKDFGYKDTIYKKLKFGWL